MSSRRSWARTDSASAVASAALQSKDFVVEFLSGDLTAFRVAAGLARQGQPFGEGLRCSSDRARIGQLCFQG